MTNPHISTWAGDDGAGRWGHWAPQILIVAVVTTVVLALAPVPAGPLSVISPAVLLAVVVATWIQMRHHDRRLCEHCVAAMPLNPSETARRYRRRLALAHLGSHRRALVAYLVVLLGADVLVALAPTALLRPAVVLWACVQSTLIYLVLSHVTHRRLQPWCPECADGGGGRDDIEAPDPVPYDSRTR